MIKETKIQTEVIEKHKFCDVCGVEIRRDLACTVARCWYCKKDLCEKCIGYEESDGSDYRTVYCKRCWEIGEHYRPLIEELGTKIEQLYTEWTNKCNQKQKRTIKNEKTTQEIFVGRTKGFVGRLKDLPIRAFVR